VPAAVDGHALTVLSGSMVPEFSPGAIVVDRPVSPSSLRVDDVITYETTDESSGEPILTTHRIVGIEQGADGPLFTTKGDANESADARPVSADQVRGEVWYSVPHVGRARDFLLAQGAPLIVGGVAGLVVALCLLSWAFRAKPEPGDGTSAPGEGRHRARTVGTGAALVGLVVAVAPVGSVPSGSYAYLTDRASISFTITGTGSPAPAGDAAAPAAASAPALRTGSSAAAAPRTPSAIDVPSTAPSSAAEPAAPALPSTGVVPSTAPAVPDVSAPEPAAPDLPAPDVAEPAGAAPSPAAPTD
jgi:signal peptidase